MKYTIIQTEKRLTKHIKTPERKDITFIDSGRIELRNLRGCNIPPCVSRIPEENQIELNKTGKTGFTVITTSYVIVSKK